MNRARSTSPTLSTVVQQGDHQQQAIAINDFIFMVNDISNAYLVTSEEGDVMINTGFMDAHHVERNQSLFEAVRSGPLRYIMLTQAHPDHYGGVPAFKEADTQIVASHRFEETWQYFHDLGPYLSRQTEKLWGSTLQRGDNPTQPPAVVPDICVDDHHTITIGNRHFELLATPGGESLDSLCVWLPDEGIVFTGNLFGPIFNAMPNLTTIRGDKPRLVGNYLSSLSRVRSLDADLLITGHGEPVSGRQAIRASLDRMHDAVAWLRGAVIAGMNAGQSVYQLMQELRLPDHLQIGEYHGKVSWAVRAIWEELSGWFHYEDSTAALYGIPFSAINKDIAELAGGADALAARATDKLTQGQLVEAILLLDIGLDQMPNHRTSLCLKQSALQTLLAQALDNLSLMMWLKSELRIVESRLSALPTDPG